MSSETTDLNLALSVKHFSFTEPDTTVPIQEKLQGRDRCWTNALDKFLNVFIMNAYTKDIPQAIEDTILSIYDGVKAFFWEEANTKDILYSRTLNIVMRKSQGVIGAAFVGRSTLNIPRVSSHPAYSERDEGPFCQPSAATLLLPLQNEQNIVVGVVQLVRDEPFDADFVTTMELFGERFKLHYPYLKNRSALEGIWGQISPIVTTDHFLHTNMKKVAAFFDCRCCEVWIKSGDAVVRYGTEKTLLPEESGGIVLSAINEKQNVNIMVNKYHPSYNPAIDGTEEESVLVCVVPTKDEEVGCAIALRSPNGRRVFVRSEEEKLMKIAPMLLVCLSNADEFKSIDDKYQASRMEKKGLHVLLDVARLISQQLDTSHLSKMIIEKGRELTNADRCSLFLLNEKKDRLITSLHSGLDSCIDIPVTSGIVGKSVTEGVALNIPDAYDIDYFDRTVDQKTGYRTKQVLSVPIRNGEGEIMGATQMVNKKDGLPFTSWDLKIMEIFNLFCGVSLWNSKLYQDSCDMSSQLRSFFDVSFSLTTCENLTKILTDIVSSARTWIGAASASLFLYDEPAGKLCSFIVDVKPDSPVQQELGIASFAAKEKQEVIVDDLSSDPRFNQNLDKETCPSPMSVLAVPMLKSDGTLLGVAEIVNKESGHFTSGDTRMVKCFAGFAALAVENSRLKDIAEFGSVEIESSKWISEEEKNGHSIPAALQLTPEQISAISTTNFFAGDFHGISLFKMIFHIFSKYHLLETFGVTNDTFFRFLFAIRQTYNEVPYHNWTHACDVTQFVACQISAANLDEVYTRFELYALLISAICHDANHNGYNNTYNIKSETPLGILFKDQSVMEMHHVTVTIRVLEDEQCNMFKTLSPADTSKIWKLVIDLILCTDMAKHFSFLKQIDELISSDSFDLRDNSMRFLSMQLLLKVSDISNVSRPFHIAEQWCNILCEEFFRQGDQEKASGIGLSSPLNDRDNVDKPKNQIGFYNFICLPTYNILSKVFPKLEYLCDNVKSNLSVWMSMACPVPPANCNE